MAWVTPRTFVTGEVTTAAHLNQIRDNLNDLDRRTNAGANKIATEQSTSSTSYTDLGTVGPEVSADVGVTGVCIVAVGCRVNPVTTHQGVMSYAVSGATTQAADDNNAYYGTTDMRACALNMHDSLNSGLNTFTAKYRSGTSGQTAFFSQRTIVAIPLAR